jgi:hypothetical protein
MNNARILWISIYIFYLAVVLIFTSCSVFKGRSPEEKQARLIKKYPQLVKTTSDTTTQTKTLIDNIGINISTDSNTFDLDLERYTRLKSLPELRSDSAKFPEYKNEEYYKVASELQALKRKLRYGSFLPTVYNYKTDSISFGLTFDPTAKEPIRLNYVEAKVKTVYVRETIKADQPKNFWDKLRDYRNIGAWVMIGAIVLSCLLWMVVSLKKLFENNQHG